MTLNLIFRRCCSLRSLSSHAFSLNKNLEFINSPRTDLLQKCPAAMSFSVSRNYGFRNSQSGKDNKKSTSSEDDDDEDDDDIMDVDPTVSQDVDGKNVKLVKARLNSLRLDTVLKAGLGTSKSKVESAFYDSKIRVNGEKVLKKSKQLHVSDEIDLIIGPNKLNTNFLDVSRVHIISVKAGETDEEKLHVILKRYKQLTIENYKDAQKNQGSE